MSGRRSRNKGKRGEREALKLLASLVPAWAPTLRRGWQSRSGTDQCDIEGTPYWIEVKRLRRVTPGARLRAMRQAVAASDGRPSLVLSRSDGDGWVFSTPLWDMELTGDVPPTSVLDWQPACWAAFRRRGSRG